MGKYKYLNEDEIRSEIEKFGTEEEKEIIAKLCADPNWDACPNCDDFERDIDKLQAKIEEAKEILE